jgi:hypothetical protein
MWILQQGMHEPHSHHENIALQNNQKSYYLNDQEARAWQPGPVYRTPADMMFVKRIRSSALLLPAPSDRLTTLLLPVVSHLHDARRILPRWAFCLTAG